MDCDGSSLSTLNSDLFNNRIEKRDSDESESQEEESDGEREDQEWNDIDKEEEKFGTAVPVI